MLWCTVLYVFHPFLSLFFLYSHSLRLTHCWWRMPPFFSILYFVNFSLVYIVDVPIFPHLCLLWRVYFSILSCFRRLFFRYIGRHCLLSLCIIIILIFIFNAKVDALGMNCRHFMRCTYALYVLFIWYEMTSTEFVLCVRWHIFLILLTLSRFHRTFCQSNSLLFLSVRFALFFCVLLLLVRTLLRDLHQWFYSEKLSKLFARMIL